MKWRARYEINIRGRLMKVIISIIDALDSLHRLARDL